MRSPQQTKGAEEEGEKKPGRVVAMILKIPVVGKMYKLYFETISKLSIVIVFYAFLKYLALLAMIGALGELSKPVSFEKNAPVVKATSTPGALAPASNDMFDALGAATGEAKLENTYYLYAYANGKSAVRVCTDLEQEEFETLTKVTSDLYGNWDGLSGKTLKTFRDTCGNTTTLAWNGGCTDEVTKTSIAGSTGFQAISQSDKDYKGAQGECGLPTVNDKLFYEPKNPGDGWLWHYMLKKSNDGIAKVEPRFLTNRTCSTSTCSNAKCRNNDCFQSGQQCLGYRKTDACGADGSNYTILQKEQMFCQDVVGNEGLNDLTGFCDCKDGRKVWMCNVAFSFRCEDTCNCLPETTDACPAGLEQCSCNETTVTAGLPEWMRKNPQYKKEECEFVFGRFNREPCEGKVVLGYAMQTDWIVNLFVAATTIRIFSQFSYMYWGCYEDTEAYKILFANNSLLICYFLLRKGNKKVNDALEKEYLQGYPWLLKLFDEIFTTVALLGVAYGADPFPEIARGRNSLLLVWLTAIKELGSLLYSLYESYTKKSWIVVGTRGVGFPFCCCITETTETEKGKAMKVPKDLPWPSCWEKEEPAEAVTTKEVSLEIPSMKEYRKLFKIIDTDNSNSIDIKEFRTYLGKTKSVQNNLSDQEINDIFRSIDVNNDSTIDYEEFAQLCVVMDISPNADQYAFMQKTSKNVKKLRRFSELKRLTGKEMTMV